MPKQAKTLTTHDLRRVLDYIATRKHAARNRAIVMTSFLAGMRACEIASLLVSDVIDLNGNIRDQLILSPSQTKGSDARVIYLSEKLRKELIIYLGSRNSPNRKSKLFYSQKQDSDGFTANSLTVFFHHLYRHVGIESASGHSGRRTFISNLASRGVSAKVLMELAGHKNLSTTQRYIEVNPNLLKQAVELA